MAPALLTPAPRAAAQWRRAGRATRALPEFAAQRHLPEVDAGSRREARSPTVLSSSLRARWCWYTSLRKRVRDVRRATVGASVRYDASHSLHCTHVKIKEPFPRTKPLASISSQAIVCGKGEGDREAPARCSRTCLGSSCVLRSKVLPKCENSLPSDRYPWLRRGDRHHVAG